MQALFGVKSWTGQFVTMSVHSRGEERSLHLSVPRLAVPLLASVLLVSCAPITHSIISLDGSSTEDLASVSILAIDSGHPLLLRGIDGQVLTTVHIPSVFCDWSFVVSPGIHLLWVSTIPYGHPLIPQFVRCYAIKVSLDPGVRYVLRYEPTLEQALLLRYGSDQPEATGRLVDKPLIFERNCLWQ